MMQETAMQFKDATQHAQQRLENDLPANLCYHGAHHTIKDVVPAAKRLADAHNLPVSEQAILLTAAWYHDIGFIEQYHANEAIAVQIVRETLPDFNYTPEQIEQVSSIILATQLGQEPTTLLERIMVDADLDSLGRPDLIDIGTKLRREQEIFQDKHLSDADWYREEIGFLRHHHYYTAAQNKARNPGKIRNFLMFCRLLMEEEQNLPR
jgi:uncharacterized protein